MTSSLLYSLLILALLSRTAFSEPIKLKYVENDTTVVLLSIAARFTVTEDSKTIYTLDLDATTKPSVKGCIHYMTPQNWSSYEIIHFTVMWNGSMSNQFNLCFNKTAAIWKWTNATFLTTITDQNDKNVTVDMGGMIGEFGNDAPIVADANNSYVCNSPLDFSSSETKEEKVKVSVTWSHFQVEVYPQNGTFDAASRPCPVDFDDKIVPIAVGGALGLLLLLVVIIYVISYIRDRRQQSKELRSGYNRIEHPEPNHHS